MPVHHDSRSATTPLIAILAIAMAALACTRSVLPADAPAWQVPEESGPIQPTSTSIPEAISLLPPTRIPGAPILTPTPDNPHELPARRTEPEQYVVQPGDALGVIAQRYGISLEDLAQANQLANPNYLEVGQLLVIPVPNPEGSSPAFKIIPDSELVYGPASAAFDIVGYIQSKAGYLANYQENDVEGATMNGAQIVQLVAENYSVNPRLLLAVLEYQSGWVTQASPNATTLDFPMNVREPIRKGLYHQLTWAANNLNMGYYLWRVNGVGTWLLGDGSVVFINPTINAGTAGIQQMFAPLYGRQDWEQAVSEAGIFAVYNTLFGYPFDLAIDPLLPPGLHQPVLQLPFEPGVPWAFTGGPHGGWDSGSAWAALDFAPPSDALGCIPSQEWVLAAADGQILRAHNGAVIEDLDGDGYEQTGWDILYMHVEARDRVPAGTYVKTGDRIGHPSCEGGVSTGTHLHIARKYNGEWIPADQSLPFVMDGWTSRGTGNLYDGFMEKNGVSIEAWEGLAPENVIQR